MLEPRGGLSLVIDFLRFRTRCSLVAVILLDLVLRKQLTSVIDSEKRESR